MAAGLATVAALRFVARRERSDVSATSVALADEEASGMVGTEFEEEASKRGATAALDERAEVMRRLVDFRALIASDDGAAVFPRAPLIGLPGLAASVLARAFLVAGPAIASSSAFRFGPAFAVLLGLTRRTRLDGSTTIFVLGARFRGSCTV